MSFNPFSTRPVGSKRYEEHLLDVMANAYYEQDEDKWKPRLEFAENPWGSSKSTAFDGWERLLVAVIANAIIDYATAYERKLECLYKGNDAAFWVWESRCLQLENGYFRKEEYLSSLFDEVINQCHKGIVAIRRMKKRLRGVAY